MKQEKLNYPASLLVTIICFLCFGNAFAQKKEKLMRVNGMEIKHIERSSTENRTSICPREPNRTIDGTCNNIEDMSFSTWGAADIELLREMPAGYGMPDYLNNMSGAGRLSPRAISNLVVAQSEDLPSSRGLSSMVFTWGQFLDHDITLTPEGHDEFAPVILPLDEPLFTTDIPFFRSLPRAGTGQTTARQQQNIITSWIDASNVYGSEQKRADWLRTFTDGKLKTSEGDLLPYNSLSGELDGMIDPAAPSMAGDGGGENKVFVAGDVRANEQPGLTSLHTLFVREHNRICDQLLNDGLTDEEIYQEARRRVAAMMQVITYEQFLPALGVDVPDYVGYDRDLQPDVTNLFATAAYRLGHTMVTQEILLLDENCEPVNGGSMGLLDAFFNPTVVPANGIAAFLQGLSSQTQQQVDTKVVDNLRNFLFPSAGGPPFGLDLASLNIQRGRDHGLPGYFETRAYYTGTVVTSFSEITSDPELQLALEQAYGNVYDMDVWVGLLAEDHLPGGSVGLTLDAILGKQFANLRDADFYYYENDPLISNGLSNQLRGTSLADIIIRNSSVENLQADVFFASQCMVNIEEDDNDDDDDEDDDDDGGNGNGGNGNGGNGNGNNGGGNGPGGNGGGNGGGGNGPGNGGGNGGGNFTTFDVNGIQNRSTETTSTLVSDLEIYPNPSTGIFNINLETVAGDYERTISVFDTNGRELHRKVVSANDASIKHQVNLHDLSSGMYIITIQSGEEIITKNIVIDIE